MEILEIGLSKIKSRGKLLAGRSLETYVEGLSFKGFVILNDSSSYTTTVSYKKGSPNDLLKILHETKILWHIIAQCPNCLQKVKEGLKNQPLPSFDERNEIQQGSI